VAPKADLKSSRAGKSGACHYSVTGSTMAAVLSGLEFERERDRSFGVVVIRRFAMPLFGGLQRDRLEHTVTLNERHLSISADLDLGLDCALTSPSIRSF
jgi:hypothetical protein